MRAHQGTGWTSDIRHSPMLLELRRQSEKFTLYLGRKTQRSAMSAHAISVHNIRTELVESHGYTATPNPILSQVEEVSPADLISMLNSLSSSLDNRHRLRFGFF